MPRRLRRDAPGSWHHVWDRGIAKRTVFETRRDVRYFLSLLARRVRSGDLEVHAYAVLTTHFHLLVRSPRGRLSSAMQRILDAYARWFNRGRRRDGPLFRGRFGSRTVDSDAYWWCLLRYIDRNPVSAGICGHPGEYPHGSARHYLSQRGPPWLCRADVEAAAGRLPGREWDPSLYRELCSGPASRGGSWVAERRMCPGGTPGADPLAELLGAALPQVRAWMERKSRLADGTVPGFALVSPDTLRTQVESLREGEPLRVLGVPRCSADAWEVLEVAGLRLLCGLEYREIAERTGLSFDAVRARLRAHVRAIDRDPSHAAALAELARRALRIDHLGPAGFRATVGVVVVVPSGPPRTAGAGSR